MRGIIEIELDSCAYGELRWAWGAAETKKGPPFGELFDTACGAAPGVENKHNYMNLMIYID